MSRNRCSKKFIIEAAEYRKMLSESSTIVELEKVPIPGKIEPCYFRKNSLFLIATSSPTRRLDNFRQDSRTAAVPRHSWVDAATVVVVIALRTGSHNRLPIVRYTSNRTCSSVAQEVLFRCGREERNKGSCFNYAQCSLPTPS